MATPSMLSSNLSMLDSQPATQLTRASILPNMELPETHAMPTCSESTVLSSTSRDSGECPLDGGRLPVTAGVAGAGAGGALASTHIATATLLSESLASGSIPGINGEHFSCSVVWTSGGTAEVLLASSSELELGSEAVVGDGGSYPDEPHIIQSVSADGTHHHRVVDAIEASLHAAHHRGNGTGASSSGASSPGGGAPPLINHSLGVADLSSAVASAIAAQADIFGVNMVAANEELHGCDDASAAMLEGGGGAYDDDDLVRENGVELRDSHAGGYHDDDGDNDDEEDDDEEEEDYEGSERDQDMAGGKLMRSETEEDEENQNVGREEVVGPSGVAKPRSRRPFQCTRCGKSFSRRRHLTVHEDAHTNTRRYNCEICGSAFRDPAHLHHHRAVHSENRPYECKICSKAFKHGGQLHRHALVHNGEHPFVCKLCGRAYTTKHNLDQHMLVHNGSPFRCQYCDRPFARMLHLENHIRTHTGERPHVCIICKSSFTQASGLSRHIKTLHPDGRAHNTPRRRRTTAECKARLQRAAAPLSPAVSQSTPAASTSPTTAGTSPTPYAEVDGDGSPGSGPPSTVPVSSSGSAAKQSAKGSRKRRATVEDALLPAAAAAAASAAQSSPAGRKKKQRTATTSTTTTTTAMQGTPAFPVMELFSSPTPVPDISSRSPAATSVAGVARGGAGEDANGTADSQTGGRSAFSSTTSSPAATATAAAAAAGTRRRVGRPSKRK